MVGSRLPQSMYPGMSGGDDPAPALPALHAAQQADGRLTRPAMESLANTLSLPLVDLYDAATFYHYFGVGDEAAPVRGVCRGPTCSLLNPSTLQVSDDVPGIACPGLCDQPTATYDGDSFGSTTVDALGGFALPRGVDTEEVLFRHIRNDTIRGLEGYRATGGYRQLERLVRGEIGAAEALEVLGHSGLTGRGGAAFPLAAKWKAVREAHGDQKYVICNADEGEPGTFKDRPILHLNPHLLLESMAIAGFLVGATAGIIYLRYEYPDAVTVLEQAIEEASVAGLLGHELFSTAVEFHLYV
ncbi:MAG: NAD(P)H-dependent oxidoreductase subunit E, partial [Chloroflexi bacterium]|nr:NAD(P)H-dependent oxidoreductase subunit E [Chloroflexota bacterium]